MTLLNKIKSRIHELINDLESNKIKDVELLELLRQEEENKSILLFYFFLEQLLIESYKRRILINSKGIIKYYIKSEYKEHEDYIFVGDLRSDPDNEEIFPSIILSRGILLKIFDKLNLTKSKKALINHLMITDDEIVHDKYLSKQEIAEYSDLDNVLRIIYDEMDAKLKDKPSVIKF